MVQYTRDVLAHTIDKHVHDVGAFTYGSPKVHWWRPDARLIIGRYCSIAGGVNIFLGGNHRVDWATTYPFSDLVKHWPTTAGIGGTPVTKGDVTIGNDVWIGSFATILSGVTIGDGAVIGAGALVSKSVPPYSITAGNPARVVRYRFSDTTIARLLRVRWWDWPLDDVVNALPSMLKADLSEFLDAHAPEGPSVNSPDSGAERRKFRPFEPDGEEGVAPPVTDGLVISFDFGARDTLQDDWGAIARCTGANGTTVMVQQDIPIHRPTRAWKNGRYCARFVASNKQFLETAIPDAYKDTISGGPNTIVIVTQLVEVQGSCLIDVARGDSTMAGVGAQRSSLILDNHRHCWTYRHGRDAVDVRSVVPVEAGSPQLLVTSRSESGEVIFSVGGTSCSYPLPIIPPEPPETLTIGARPLNNSHSMYLDGYIWRVMIYSRLLDASEIDNLFEWGVRYFKVSQV